MTPSTLYQIAYALSVPQVLSIAEILKRGARYLDLRISAGADGNIYLSHSFISGITFDSVLDQINSFMLSHPSEILLLDINNDFDTNGIVGTPVAGDVI